MIQNNLHDIELVDPELATGACRSLEKIVHLVVNPREIEYYGHLLSGARALFTSSSDGRLSLISSNLNMPPYPHLFCAPPQSQARK